jgi:hypothetical protein
MSEIIIVQDADGNRISGRFYVSDGMITVTASDGRTKAAQIEKSMLSHETLARMLLASIVSQGRSADRPS